MSILKVKVSGKKLTITWKKAKNAKKYTVSIKDKANRAGDTLYVLQGRNEVGLRGFNPERATTIYKRYAEGDTKNYVFGSEYGRGNNEAQLKCMIDNKLDVETAINDFAIKTAADDAKYKLPFKYGFVTGVEGEGLGEKFGIDFSGYHSQN